MRIIVLAIALLRSLAVNAQQDTINLYFDLNIRTMNTISEARIDSLIYHDIILPNDNIVIIGFADYLGSEKHNQDLSEARAKNVKTYLVKYGVDSAHVKLCIGKGEIERTGINNSGGFPADRRVAIVLERKRHKKTNKELPVKQKPVHVQSSVDLSVIANYEPGQVFILHNIYFPAQSHDIHASLPILDQLYNVLAKNPKLKIQIEGHVCCIYGYPDAFDMDSRDNHLSLNRAKAIYDYLVRRGIPANRLKYIGYGKSRPIVAHEKSEEDAEKNRRVEIRILEK